MRRHSALVIGIIVGTLILTTGLPAHSAERLRVYKGETSQGHNIKFKVARTEAGRFIREMGYGVTFTCEDQTTFDTGIGWGLFGNYLPITEGAFSFDEVFGGEATHIAGELGQRRGSGTMIINLAWLTDDEQPQLCTTGDLTWEVEFVRIITRSRLAAAESRLVRAA